MFAENNFLHHHIKVTLHKGMDFTRTRAQLQIMTVWNAKSNFIDTKSSFAHRYRA